MAESLSYLILSVRLCGSVPYICPTSSPPVSERASSQEARNPIAFTRHPANRNLIVTDIRPSPAPSTVFCSSLQVFFWVHIFASFFRSSNIELCPQFLSFLSWLNSQALKPLSPILFNFPSLQVSLNSQDQDHFLQICVFSAHIFNFFSLQFLFQILSQLTLFQLRPFSDFFFYSAFRGAYFHFVLFFYLQISTHFLTCFLPFSCYFILFFLSFLFSMPSKSTKLKASGSASHHKANPIPKTKPLEHPHYLVVDNTLPSHIFSDRSLFTTYVPLRKSHKTVFGSNIIIEGIGDVHVHVFVSGKSILFRFQDLWHVPSSPHHFFSCLATIPLENQFMIASRSPRMIFSHKCRLAEPNLPKYMPFQRVDNLIVLKFRIPEMSATSISKLWS